MLSLKLFPGLDSLLPCLRQTGSGLRSLSQQSLMVNAGGGGGSRPVHPCLDLTVCRLNYIFIIFMQALNCCRNGEWNWHVNNAAIGTSESSSDIES